MASFRKRTGKLGDTWQARVYVGGKAAVKSFPTKTAAKVWAAKEENALNDRAINPDGRMDAKGVTVSTALRAYVDRRKKADLTASFYDHMKWFERDFGDLELTQLSKVQLEEYFIARGKTVTAQTITVGLSYFSGFWKSVASRYSVRHTLVQDVRGLLSESNLIAVSNERKRPDPADLAAVREYFKNEYKGALPMLDMIDFSIATSMRRGELVRIARADWVDSDKPTIEIKDRKDPKNKKGNDGIIPLLGDANAILRRQPDRGPLFFPYSGKTVSMRLHQVCGTLGIKDFVWHDLRHEGLSRLADSGWTIPQMCKVSGHKKWEHLQRYVDQNVDDLHSLPYIGK